MKKKLMATLLALALVLSLVPTVFAALPSGCIESGNETCTESNGEVTHAAACPNKCQKSGCTKSKTTGNYCDDHQSEGGNPSPSPTTPAVVCSGDATVEGVCKAKTHTGNCIELCDKTSDCPGGNNHKTGCLKASSCQSAGDNSGKTDCPRTTGHQSGCPKKCTTTGCTKTVNHTDKHEGTDCTEDSRCPVNAATADAEKKHTAGCASSCPVEGCNLNKGHSGLHMTGSSCSGDTKCSVDGTGTHTAGCPHKCTGAANCTALTHATNCVRKCTGSATCPMDADATVTIGEETVSAHKANCVKLCTYDPESAAADNGLDCPNTSGDPTVHIAGCPKANVSDSIVLDPNGNPVESTDPSEEPTESQPTEITKAEDFSDVNADDWFAPYLTAVVEKGWLKGNEDGSFDPDGEVSGQQAVVFVSRMLGKDLVTTGANWADEATAWAAEDGLTEGIEITSEGIARKDLILLLWRAAGKHTSDHEITFSDVDELEGDYLTALKWAVENKIIQGNDDGTAAPNAATSRSEIAAMLDRYDKAVNK